jgi:predicted MFS family arabinose efflux permease
MKKSKTKESIVKFSLHQKIVVALLAITQFTVVLDLMVISPLGDILMKSLSITPKQFGLAVSCYAFSAAFSGILTAGFADKFDRKKLLLFFYAGFIIGTFFCSIAPNYHFLLLARTFTGFFGGVMGSISLTIVADLFSLDMRGRAMGIIQMGFAASQVLGIPVGLYLANLWGWHAPFSMIAILGFCIAILIIKYLEPIKKHLEEKRTANIWHHYRDILIQPNYQLGFIAIALVSLGTFLMQPFASAYLINNLKVSQNQLPLVFMFTGIGSLIVMPLVGKLADKMDKFSLFAIGTVWAIIFLLIYTHLWVLPLWVIIAVNILFFIGAMSRMVPAMAIISAVPEAKDRGACMSINSSLQQLAGGLGAAIAGMIIVQKAKYAPLENVPLLGYVSIVIMMLCAWFMYKVSVSVKNKKIVQPIVH